MKRFLNRMVSLLLVVSMCLTMVPVLAFAEEDSSEETTQVVASVENEDPQNQAASVAPVTKGDSTADSGSAEYLAAQTGSPKEKEQPLQEEVKPSEEEAQPSKEEAQSSGEEAQPAREEVSVVTLTDDKECVIVTGLISENAELRVELTEGEVTIDEKAGVTTQWMYYTISLGGVQPNGELQVALRIPESFTGDVSVWNLNEEPGDQVDGELEEEYYVFETNEVGRFGLRNTAAWVPEKATPPEEGAKAVKPETEAVYACFDNNVTVAFTAEAIPQGINPEKVVVSVKAVELDAETLVNLAAEGRKVASYVAYDIRLIDGETGKDFEPVAAVNVTMPAVAAEPIAASELSVAHITSNQKIEMVEEFRVESEEVSFDAASFSTWVMLLTVEEPEEKTVTATVAWAVDEAHTDMEQGQRPASVVLHLYVSADKGQTWTEYVTLDENGVNTAIKEVTPNEGGSWSASWTVPASDSEGNTLVYKPVQEDVFLYNTTVTPAEVDDFADHFTVTNTYTNQTWNYLLNLSWDTDDVASRTNRVFSYDQNGNPIFKVQLTVRTNVAYAAGKMQIRVPRELFKSRDGSMSYKFGATSSDVSVPLKPYTNNQYPFYYYVDSETDELVFENWRDLEAGYNISMNFQAVVSADQDVADFTDCEVKATGIATDVNHTAAEIRESNSISLRMDSGVQRVQIAPGFQTARTDNLIRVYSENDLGSYFTSEQSHRPEALDTENYHYFVYGFKATNWNAQSYATSFTVDAGPDGEIVGWDSSRTDFQHREAEGETGEDWYFTGLGNGTDYVYFLVRYPINEDEKNVDITHEYTYAYGPFQVTMTTTGADEHEGDKEEGIDENDVKSDSASRSVAWKHLEYHYPKGQWSADKQLSGFPTAGALMLQRGENVTGHVRLSASAYLYCGKNTWNDGEPHMPYKEYEGENGTVVREYSGYQLTLEDQDLTIGATSAIGDCPLDFLQLQDGDYKYSNITMEVVNDSVDPATGGTIDVELSEGDFVLYGKTSLAASQWTEIKRFRMTSGRSMTVKVTEQELSAALASTITEGTETDETYGFVSLYMVSPERMMDHSRIELNMDITLFGSKQTYQRWVDESGAMRANTVKLTNKCYSTLNIPEGFDEDAVPKRGYTWPATVSMGSMSGSSKMTKTAGTPTLDPSRYYVKVPYVISYRQTFGAGLRDEDYAAIADQEGVFYDLLPEGHVLDESVQPTVFNYSTKGTGAYVAGYVDYELVPNYQNTGRQMVIFRVEAEGVNVSRARESGFDLRYSTKVSVNQLDFLPEQTNITAYQREDGAPIGGGASNVPASAFSLLSEYTQKKGTEGSLNTCYASCSVSVSVLQTVAVGIQKLVKGENQYYSTKDKVALGDVYSYALTLTTNDGGVSSNAIVIDKLEAAGYESEAAWKGTFDHVDISALQRKGVNPVVYYTMQDIVYDFDQTNNSNSCGLIVGEDGKATLDPNVWSTEVPADKSAVKAIAVDMTYNAQGGEYEFQAEETAMFEVYMTAPATRPAGDERSYAYNSGSFWVRYRAESSSLIQSGYVQSDRTALELGKLQDVVITKMATTTDDSGVRTSAPLPGITFNLFRGTCTNEEEGHVHTSSCAESTVCRTATSNGRGKLTLANLDDGFYILKEVKNDQYFLNDSNNYWIVRVDTAQETYTIASVCANNDELTDEAVYDAESNSWVIQNYPPVSFRFVKIDAETGEPLSGANFSLSYCSKPDHESCWDSASKTVSSNSEGVVSFTNLKPGYYRITETKTPNGYSTETAYVYFEVADGGFFNVTSELTTHIGTHEPLVREEDEAGNVVFKLKNYKAQTIPLLKLNAETGQPIPKIRFRIYRCDTDHTEHGTVLPRYGNPSDSCWTEVDYKVSDSNGIVSIDAPISGYYAVEERDSDNTYSNVLPLSGRYWVFKVDNAAGTVSYVGAYVQSELKDMNLNDVEPVELKTSKIGDTLYYVVENYTPPRFRFTKLGVYPDGRTAPVKVSYIVYRCSKSQDPNHVHTKFWQTKDGDCCWTRGTASFNSGNVISLDRLYCSPLKKYADYEGDYLLLEYSGNTAGVFTRVDENTIPSLVNTRWSGTFMRAVNGFEYPSGRYWILNVDSDCGAKKPVITVKSMAEGGLEVLPMEVSENPDENGVYTFTLHNYSYFNLNLEKVAVDASGKETSSNCRGPWYVCSESDLPNHVHRGIPGMDSSKTCWRSYYYDRNGDAPVAVPYDTAAHPFIYGTGQYAWTETVAYGGNPIDPGYDPSTHGSFSAGNYKRWYVFTIDSAHGTKLPEITKVESVTTDPEKYPAMPLPTVTKDAETGTYTVKFRNYSFPTMNLKKIGVRPNPQDPEHPIEEPIFVYFGLYACQKFGEEGHVHTDFWNTPLNSADSCWTRVGGCTTNTTGEVSKLTVAGYGPSGISSCDTDYLLVELGATDGSGAFLRQLNASGSMSSLPNGYEYLSGRSWMFTVDSGMGSKTPEIKNLRCVSSDFRDTIELEVSEEPDENGVYTYTLRDYANLEMSIQKVVVNPDGTQTLKSGVPLCWYYCSEDDNPDHVHYGVPGSDSSKTCWKRVSSRITDQNGLAKWVYNSSENPFRYGTGDYALVEPSFNIPGIVPSNSPNTFEHWWVFTVDTAYGTKLAKVTNVYSASSDPDTYGLMPVPELVSSQDGSCVYKIKNYSSEFYLKKLGQKDENTTVPISGAQFLFTYCTKSGEEGHEHYGYPTSANNTNTCWRVNSCLSSNQDGLMYIASIGIGFLEQGLTNPSSPRTRDFALYEVYSYATDADGEKYDRLAGRWWTFTVDSHWGVAPVSVENIVCHTLDEERYPKVEMTWNEQTHCLELVDNKTLDFSFTKLGVDTDGNVKPLADASFTLIRCSYSESLSGEKYLGQNSTDTKNYKTHEVDHKTQGTMYWRDAIATVKSDENGVVTFKGIPSGCYFIYEGSSVSPYDSNPSRCWHIDVNCDAGTISDPVAELMIPDSADSSGFTKVEMEKDAHGNWTLRNPIRMNVAIEKLGVNPDGSTECLPGVQFKVYYAKDSHHDDYTLRKDLAPSQDSEHWALLGAGETDENGLLSIGKDGVTRGYFAVEETGGVEGFHAATGRWWIVYLDSFTREARVEACLTTDPVHFPAVEIFLKTNADGSRAVLEDGSPIFQIRNGKPQSVTINKVRLYGHNSSALEGVKFSLYFCGNFAADHEHTGITGADSCWALIGDDYTSDEAGKVVFSNLASGHYLFIENAVKDASYYDTATDRYWTFDVDILNPPVAKPVAHTWNESNPAVELEVPESKESNNWILTNTVKQGAIRLTMNVTGNAGRSADEFTYTITLSDQTINGTYGDVEFKDGVAVITLSDPAVNNSETGASVTIRDLPFGITYTSKITAGHETIGYTVAARGGETGTVAADAVQEINYVHNRDGGDLKLTMNATGNGASSEDAFTYEITFTAPKEVNPKSVDGTYDAVANGKETTVTVKDGKTVITLMDSDLGSTEPGENIVIKGILAGTTFEAVNTVDNKDMGYTTEKAEGLTGTIVKDTVARIAYEYQRLVGELTVSKVVAGNDASREKAFTFTVTLSDETITGTYGEMRFAEGVATFTLKDGESRKAENILAGTSYTVVESDYTRDGYVTTKTGETGTIESDSPKTAVFTNTRDTFGNLKVSKKVSGNGASKKTPFKFTVQLSDNSINGTYGDMTFTDGVATFKLKHGEHKTAEGLPNGLIYEVVENDASGYTVSKSGDSGKIIGNKTVTAKFTNTRVVKHSKNPKTGDDSNMMDWILLILAAVAVMIVTFFAGKRRKQRDK